MAGYLTTEDLSKKLGIKNPLGFVPPPIAPAAAAVNPLISPAGPASAPAAASAPVIPTVPAAPAIQSQPAAQEKSFDVMNQEEMARLPGPVKSADRPAWMNIGQKMEHPGEKSSVLRRAVADPLISLVGKGFTGVPQAFVGLADIPTLGRAGKALEKIGIDFKTTQEIFNSMMSPEAREAQKRVGDAEGFANTIVEAVKNPSTIVNSTLQSLPSMIGGGGIARGLMKKIPSLSPLVAAAIGEGAISAGQNLEDSRKDGGTLTAKQVGIGAASGIATAALGLFGGKAAKWMGIDDVDVLLSGASREAKKGVLLKVLGAIFQEGALEELPQSMQEQIAGNLNAGRLWSDGVLEAGAQGMLAGGLMGGGANIITSILGGGDAATQAAPTAPADPNAPPVNPLMAKPPSQTATEQETSSVFDAPVAPINPLLAKNQPTTNAEDEAAVRKAMDARGPAYAGIRAVEPAPSAGVAAVKEISDKIGLRVIWIDGAPVGGRAIQGAAPAGENTIFLHTDLLTNPKRDPVMMVYAHELTHRSERASPKEYGILRDSVLARAEARASVEEKVASGMSRAAAESEAVAEQVEVLGTDQAFWQEVFAGKEQSFIEHIIQIVTDMAQRVFGTNQAAKAEAIRGAAVSAFQALQAQSQGQNQNQNQTINQQEAANGVQEGKAQEVAQPLQATATAEAAIQGTPEIKAPPEAKAAPASKPSRSEVAKLRRESEAAKAERARLRESKRKAEIEYNKKFKGSGLTRKQAAKARRIYDYDRGDAPVLSVVIDQFGGINEASAKAFGIDKASIPRSIREKLFPKDGKGSNWNDITWAIEHDNLIPGVMRADEVGSHIVREIESINRLAKENKAMAQAYRQRSEDERGFKRAIIRDDKNAKVRREAVDLREGDVLVRKIEGIPVEFTVSEVEDTTGNIVLKSTLYGRQPVEYFEMVHADKLIPAEEAVGGAEDVPFSTKEVGEEGETLASTASSIEDEAERDAFARSELEKRAGVPLVKGPKNLSELSQNHVVATAKDLLDRLAEGEIDAVEAMESLEAVENRVGAATKRADAKAAREAKAAGESRQQGLPGMEGLAKSPYGTPDNGENGVLFSAKKLTQEDLENNGQGREREYSISRFFSEKLKREWAASYKQKSAQQAIGELQAITEKHGEDWVMDHLFDLSKETQAEFPMALRPLAARHIIDAADKAFRAWGINDDGSNMPMSPLVDNLWLKIEDIRNKAAAYEREGGRGMAWLRSTYEANNINSPVGVRKTINKLHDKLAAPVIGPVKAPIIEKVTGEAKTAYDEAIAALEEERKANAEKDETISTLRGALSKNIVSDWETKIRRPAESNPAARRALDEKIAEKLAKLRAGGSLMSGLSTQAEISLARDAVFVYMGVHGADIDGVSSFLKRELPGQTLSEDAVMALMKDVENEMAQIVRAATKEASAPRKGEAKPRKGATVISRAPDMTIQGPTSGPQRLFDSGKMWGEGRVLNIGEGDAKRLALELTEAGQTVMRGISSNVEVVISNALRHGRNAAGIEKVLVDSGIDPDTARRMVKNIVRRRAEMVRPALETLRQKYAAKGDKVSRTIASAMDKIMSAMELADRASTSQVSGFFDGNAWDESRRIIEEAFGFKSEITRDWFNETMRLYREYEKADEAGNHVLSASLHTDLLNRVAHVQNKGDWWLAVRAYIQGGMLSSFRTQEWNFMSTASRAIGFSYVQASRQFIRFAQTGNPKYLAGAYLPFEILFRSHNQATALFRHIMKTGVNPFVMRVGDEAKFGTDPNTASAAEYMAFFQWKLNRGFKYICRLLRAADAYFRVGIENSDIVMRSYNSLIKNGQKVPDAIKRSVGLVGFVTDGTNDAYNNASKKADELGLVGFERKMNILIDMRNALDPEYLEKAKLRGAIETFNDPDPEGLVGGLADWARHHSSAPGMFWMGMFARVGANLFNHMQHTAPLWSAMMLAKDTTIGRYKGGESNVRVENKEDIEIRAVRAATSLALATLVVGLCLKSLKDFDDDDEPDETKKKYRFMLTAGGPSDTTLRKNWEKVEKPYTLSVNGQDFSYKWMSGLTAVLAMVGAWMDEKRYGSLKNESIDGRNSGPNLDLVLTMSFGMMDAMTSDIPGQALIDFFDVIKTAGKPGSEKMRGMEKWAEKNLASFGSAIIPYSRAVIDVDRIVDGESTTARNMAGMKGFFFSTFRDIPYVRNRLLYPYRDIWGEPITYPANANDDMGIVERSARYMLDRFINNTKNDPDIKFLVAAQARIRAPYPNETSIITTEGGKYGLRNMTDKEYDEFLVLFGAELRTQIGLVRELYSSSEQYKKYIRPDNESLKKSISEARSNAMKWAMYKYFTKTGKQISKSKE